MQITIDDTIYHDLAEKIGSTNVSAYIQSLLQPILYFNAENCADKIQENQTRNTIKTGNIEDTFGLFTAKNGVSLEEMDEAIRRCGAGL